MYAEKCKTLFNILKTQTHFNCQNNVQTSLLKYIIPSALQQNHFNLSNDKDLLIINQIHTTTDDASKIEKIKNYTPLVPITTVKYTFHLQQVL